MHAGCMIASLLARKEQVGKGPRQKPSPTSLVNDTKPGPVATQSAKEANTNGPSGEGIDRGRGSAAAGS
jgi:hypothetical protein